MKFEISYLDCAIPAPVKTLKYLTEARNRREAEEQFYNRVGWIKSLLLVNITEI